MAVILRRGSYCQRKCEQIARDLLELGIDKLDAVHYASIVGGADYFVTTDDRILKRADKIAETNIMSPTDLVAQLR